MDKWVKHERKHERSSKWWRLVPRDWVLFGEHFKIAHAMTDSQYTYLLSLPLTIYIPSAHAYVAHAGLLPSDPDYTFDDHRQPLAHIPSFPPLTKTGKTKPKNDTIPLLRGLQELAILRDVPQNTVPFNVLNMRSVLNGEVTK